MRIIILILFLGLLIHPKIYSQSDALGHEKWEYILEDAGDVLQLAIPVSAGIITLLKDDIDGSKKLAFSYGTTLILTYSLKYITAKKRPEGRNQYDSFPSGHTSSAFSAASFLQRRYGSKFGIPAYVLAGVVGISRMEGPDGYHDIWDVLGGAAIGIGSTHLFTKPYKKPKLEMSFTAKKSYTLFTMNYRF